MKMKIKILSKSEINSLVEKLIAISLISETPKIKQIKSFELNDEIEIFSSSNFILVRNQDELFPFLQDSNTISLGVSIPIPSDADIFSSKVCPPSVGFTSVVSPNPFLTCDPFACFSILSKKCFLNILDNFAILVLPVTPLP